MSRRSEGTSKQDLARSIIANAKAAGIKHFVLDFDGTIVANHFFYNEEYGRKFYDQDPNHSEYLAYKTGLKPEITQAQAKGFLPILNCFKLYYKKLYMKVY